MTLHTAAFVLPRDMKSNPTRTPSFPGPEEMPERGFIRVPASMLLKGKPGGAARTLSFLL
jgi:hypothetical protein